MIEALVARTTRQVGEAGLSGQGGRCKRRFLARVAGRLERTLAIPVS